MDDICPQMNMEKFLEYKMLFDEFDIRPLIGIIPDNQDDSLKYNNDFPNFWEMMRQLQQDGWAIAQHGYQHVYDSEEAGILSKRKLSEFAGLSYENQVEKIKKGQRILAENELSTDIFMAPGHSYDLVTLRALKDCGFKYVTDGLSSFPYRYCGLKFVPCRHMTPLILPGINTWAIHANTWKEKDFNRIKRLLHKKRYVHNFKDLLDIPCLNTHLCQTEEKFYELSQEYVIIPLLKLISRIHKCLRNS
jgi:Uncharacterized protein conserved in bacteria (DUF2334).